jgi:hypothetical protein
MAVRRAEPKQKRIYHASTTSLTIPIADNSGKRIGVLSFEPTALNALSWLHKNKQEASRKTKTMLSLVEWMEES